MSQIKEQDKTPEKELNEIEANKLPDTKFKPMVIRMFKELSKNFNSIQKGMENLKKNESDMKDTISEMKNTVEGINSKLDESENQIRDLEGKQQKAPNQNSKKEEEIFK